MGELGDTDPLPHIHDLTVVLLDGSVGCFGFTAPHHIISLETAH